MPKFNIPLIVRPIKLAEYQPEYGEATIWTWANPPEEFLRERQEVLGRIIAAQKEIVSVLQEMQKDPGDEQKLVLEAQRDACIQHISDEGEATMRWISRAWSQHSDPAEHWPLEEVHQLVEQTAGTNGTDPGLWTWLVKRTLDITVEYRNARKKG